MREIIFKAKRLDNGEWVQGLLTVMWGQYHIINPNDENTAYPINTDTVCQYTGLTDKNGNMIWENDIIQYIDGELSVNGVVRFGRHEQIVMLELGFYVEWVSDEAISFKTDVCYWVEKRDIEVIGNVFDHTDLLKGE